MPDTVLAPFTAGRLDLPNRLAFLATVNNLGRNTEITDDLVAYYAARARGGAGMIVTEGLSVHPTSIPNGTAPLAYDESLVPGVTDVHSEGLGASGVAQGDRGGRWRR